MYLDDNNCKWASRPHGSCGRALLSGTQWPQRDTCSYKSYEQLWFDGKERFFRAEIFTVSSSNDVMPAGQIWVRDYLCCMR